MSEIKNIFGWNANAWALPFRQAIDDYPLPDGAQVLELGAGAQSSLALFFLKNNHHLTITAYPEWQVSAVKAFVTDHVGVGTFHEAVSCMSIKQVTGTYDVILMKSVLGGVFREGSTTLEDVMALIENIVRNNLKQGGVLMTMDNGATFAEPLFSRFGARANRWRFFIPSDFKGFTKQYKFGLLSSFSFVTRFGKIGEGIEDLLYILDFFIYRFFKIARPSIILTIYKKHD